MKHGSLYSHPPRRKCRLIPLGASVVADGFVTATSSASAQPSGTVNVKRIESSSVDSVQPAWPTQTPSICPEPNGVAVCVPTAIRSPITSYDGLGVALGGASDGLIVGVGTAVDRGSGPGRDALPGRTTGDCEHDDGRCEHLLHLAPPGKRAAVCIC